MSDFPQIVAIVRFPDGRIAAENQTDVGGLTRHDLAAIEAAMRLWLWVQVEVREEGPYGEFDLLVSMVKQLLDTYYPEHIFTGESGDPGPVFVARLREALAALESETPESRTTARRGDEGSLDHDEDRDG